MARVLRILQPNGEPFELTRAGPAAAAEARGDPVNVYVGRSWSTSTSRVPIAEGARSRRLFDLHRSTPALICGARRC